MNKSIYFRKILNFLFSKRKTRIFKNYFSRFNINKNINPVDASINFIDVGSIGSLPEPWASNLSQIKNILRFEPTVNQQNYENIISFNFPLAEDNIRKNLHIFNSPDGASLLEQNYDFIGSNYQNLKKYGNKYLAKTWFERSLLKDVKKVDCKKLDDVLTDLKNKINYHFLKIDVQGAEHLVLKGAETYLANQCIGIQLEAYLVPIMKNLVLLPDLIEYLSKFGFELKKQYPACGSFDSQCDCVFLKKSINSEEINIIKKVYGI